ncbi:MAG: Gfo/Idh/MocA family oxidoreductase [Puniceicoccales bacterium]|jgi:predicted dehydrogenase|nr:Gfo/Idh/MocA family oxidoreductase [Puniceicoccales bacterium]
MKTNHRISLRAATSRRAFLKNSAAALATAAFLPAFPALVPARVLGRDGATAPSNRINLGVVGANSQGWSDFRDFFAIKGVEPVAVCDVDRGVLNGRANETAKRRGVSPETIGRYGDFREMFDKAKLDAVVIGTPDHWHAIIAIAAARKGIHIYGEKPLAHTLVEGRAIVNAVKQHGVVWQTGSWQRSRKNFHRAVELVRNGAIGKITHAEVGTLEIQNGFDWSLASSPDEKTLGKPPAELDYDMWVGPAQFIPYDKRFTRYHWRWVLNFGGGNLMDWVGHHVDIAHWALDFDTTGPLRVEPDLNYREYSTKLPFDAETKYDYKCTYATGQYVHVASRFPTGVRFYGEKGKWLRVDRGRLHSSNDAEILNAANDPNAAPVYRSENHSVNFIECVRAGRVEGTITPAETAHRSASVGHLGHIAMQTGRTIHWNPLTETIKGDPAAAALLSPNYRAPWVL